MSTIVRTMYPLAAFFLSLLIAPATSLALTITKASVEDGMLLVEGTTKKRNKTVKLDGEFETTSNADKMYAFSVLYHPIDCIIKVKRGNLKQKAVVTGCGVKGDRGKRGKRGLDGPEGPEGPQGLEGPEGPEGPQGIQGLKGDTGDQGIQGLKGGKGDKGDPGNDGVGAGDWWYINANVNDTVHSKIQDAQGNDIDSGFAGLIFCSTPVTGTATIPVSAMYHVQRDSQTPGNWYISRMTEDSFASTLPYLYVNNDILMLRNNWPGVPWPTRCRMEKISP